jgi:hypothetical protein
MKVSWEYVLITDLFGLFPDILYILWLYSITSVNHCRFNLWSPLVGVLLGISNLLSLLRHIYLLSLGRVVIRRWYLFLCYFIFSLLFLRLYPRLRYCWIVWVLFWTRSFLFIFYYITVFGLLSRIFWLFNRIFLLDCNRRVTPLVSSFVGLGLRRHYGCVINLFWSTVVVIFSARLIVVGGWILLCDSSLL